MMMIRELSIIEGRDLRIKKQEGLYQNKVNSSLTSSKSKMAYF